MMMLPILLVCLLLLLLPAAAASTNNTSKKLKVCSVLGGLDIVRLRSYETRQFFISAVEDIDLVREYLAEAAYNGGQEGPGAGLSDPDEMAQTLDTIGRGLPPPPTIIGNSSEKVESLSTFDLGLGWTDDSPDRRVERWISASPNQPLVGTKATDMALVSSVSNLLPWILDRRSAKENWWTDHTNGGSLMDHGSTVPFVFSAIWVHSYSDALIYYPPFQNLAPYLAPPNQTALTLADVAGGDFNGRTQGASFTSMAWPENNPNKTHVFLSPYPDQAQVGESTFTLIAPVYLTGEFVGNVYNNTFFGTAGIDIKISAVSALFSDLDDQLTPGSFALLASVEDFSVIAISPYGVAKIYPSLTGMEESRPDDRRNVTYMPSDTIFQTPLELENGDWDSLLAVVDDLPRGRRSATKFNVTITGDDSPTEFNVMYDRWDSIANWALLVFAPVQEVQEAVIVDLSKEEVYLQVEEGQDATLTNISIINSGRLNVLVTARDSSKWIDLQQPMAGFAKPVGAGEHLDIAFAIKSGGMPIGNTSTLLTFSVQDDDYSDCFFNKEISLRVSINVVPAENLNQIDKIRPVGLTLAALVVSLSIFFAGWVFKHRNVRAIKASQPVFLMMVCFGTLLLGSTIIPLSIDDSISSQRGCNIACMAAPWLFSLGFTTVFSTLFSKIWRINRIFRHAKGFRRVKVSEKDVLVPFLVLLVLNVSLLTVWTALDPLRWVRVYQEGRESLNSSHGYCTSENSKVSFGFGIALTIINMLALILANVEAYMARNISDEYSESKYIAVAMAMTFQIFAIGIPILFLVEEDPTAKFFVSSGIIFAVSISMLLLMFIPKILHLKKQNEEKGKPISVRGSSASLGIKYTLNGPETQIEFNEYKRKIEGELYDKLKHGMNVDRAFRECGIEKSQGLNSKPPYVSASTLTNEMPHAMDLSGASLSDPAPAFDA